ncbi:hypothetical protein F511_20122 [Dorcoceras hygrometricum]|uniref:U-box domain-containing protein n=1 Tax=Dorcoceras hygrometricum TaxID=472368 RepID=A0A2Z7A9V4_9LAMI|nr:hypothetical protein F511_20122 [Dorcoceras hygrometricum]
MSAPQVQKKSESLNNWFFACTELRFFTRIRRFLRLKSTDIRRKTPEKQQEQITVEYREVQMEDCMAGELEAGRDCGDGRVVVLHKSVKRLHFGSWEEKEAAAEEIQKLAGEDLRRRKTMAELGVIPPLVSMVGSEVVARRRMAVRALIELANGSFANKAQIVEAGFFSKLPEKIDLLEETQKQELAHLILSISALANSHFSLKSTGMIPFVVSTLESSSSNIDTKESCLKILYNLSSILDNTGPMINSGAIETLIKSSVEKLTSEKALATLGNLVVTVEGRKALEHNPVIPEVFIEIMTWEEKHKCQELSSYILMILVHQSSFQRQKMAKAGIVQVLLGVALLGSPLAQKRALKILQWFKNDRQVRMGPHSGPQVGRVPPLISSPLNQRDFVEGKRLMNNMVRQSLYKNMENITRRANAAGDSSKMKALVISSSSKSLTY